MKANWNKFWKEKGNYIEWSAEEMLESEFSFNLSGNTLLELGAGLGITSIVFANSGIEITLLDYSEEAKKKAKEYWKITKLKHKYIVKDLFNYNPKKRYDIVTSFGLCEHFVGKERYRVLKRHIDLLNEKGIAVISAPYKYGIFYRVTKYLQELTGYWSFGVEVPFSKKEYELFALMNNLDCEIYMSGFYSSIYDLFRKPLKVFNIHLKRRFDNTKSVWDNWFGSGILVILK